MAPPPDEGLDRLLLQLSEITGIPVARLHAMTKQEMERAVIGDDLGPPEEGEYTEIYPDESER